MPMVVLGQGPATRLAYVAAGGGGGFYPNQPGGYTRFAEWDCTTIPATGGSGTVYNDTSPVRFGAWYNSNNPAHAHVTTNSDATAPQSPSGTLRNTFYTGLIPGDAPVWWGGWDSAGTDGEAGAVKSAFYQSIRFRLVSGSGDGNWQSQSVGTKFLGFVGYGENPAVHQNEGFHLISGGTHPAFTYEFRTQNLVSRNLTQNIDATAYVTVNTWHQLECQLVLNSGAGVADGIFRAWIDGVLVSQYTDVVYLTSGNVVKFNIWYCNSTWGGSGGGNVLQDQYIDVDHIYMSGVA